MDKALTRRVLLGVTGGIAAYKVAELARLLMRNNVDVRVAMTDAATKFVTPATFQALTGKPVVTDLWDASFENNMRLASLRAYCVFLAVSQPSM